MMGLTVVQGVLLLLAGLLLYIYPKEDALVNGARTFNVLGIAKILIGTSVFFGSCFWKTCPANPNGVVISDALAMCAFLLILYFAAKTYAEIKGTRPVFKWIGFFAVITVWLVLTRVLHNKLGGLTASSRYLIFAPASSLTAVVFFISSTRFDRVKFPTQHKGLRRLGVVFCAYTFMPWVFPGSSNPFSLISFYPESLAVQPISAVVYIGFSVYGFVGVLGLFRRFYEEKYDKLFATLQQFHKMEGRLRSITTEFLGPAANIAMSDLEFEDTLRLLHLEKTNMEAVVNSIKESVMLISRDFKILWANKVARELAHALFEGDIIKKHCYEVTHRLDEPCRPPSDPCPISESVVTGKPATVIHTHLDPNGREFIVEVSVYPVKDEMGRVTSFVHVARNITDKLEMERDVKIKMAELERFSKVAVGREFKMKELKERIKELEKKLEEKGLSVD